MKTIIIALLSMTILASCQKDEIAPVAQKSTVPVVQAEVKKFSMKFSVGSPIDTIYEIQSAYVGTLMQGNLVTGDYIRFEGSGIVVSTALLHDGTISQMIGLIEGKSFICQWTVSEVTGQKEYFINICDGPQNVPVQIEIKKLP
jgi:hypothetical protein